MCVEILNVIVYLWNCSICDVGQFCFTLGRFNKSALTLSDTSSMFLFFYRFYSNFSINILALRHIILIPNVVPKSLICEPNRLL